MRFVAFLCAVFCATTMLPAIALGASDLVDDRGLCVELGGRGTWTPRDKPASRFYAQEFLRKADLNVGDILICQSRKSPVWSFLFKRKGNMVFVIGLSRDFSSAQSEHMRAWMAHEVAHWVPRGKDACQNSRSMTEEEMDIRCEHEIDRIAAGWVGKPAMLAALYGMRDYLLDMKERTRLARRIALLEAVSDLRLPAIM
ncbi:MAG: hypothetical protein Q7S52_02075 [bacterium]|nr:hypothetical protein [bacterium]